jgi:23S rRNA (guanosine2251-2'-O)-methyltransferase
MKLGAKQLRITKPDEEQLVTIKRKRVWIVLDNVMDTYNIGAIFRLADAVAAQELILCAGTETPPSSRIHKSAVGTESWVAWKYFQSALEALLSLKAKYPTLKIIVIEQDSRAVQLSKLTMRIPEDQPIAVVVGHETDGVSQQVMNFADVIVEIPMWGVNKSLNVVVSLGIVLYKILESWEG